MRTLLRAMTATLALAMTACGSPPSPRAVALPPVDNPTKGLPPLPGPAPAAGHNILNSVYLPVQRNTPIPTRYGLYTVILTRKVDRVSTRLLGELFTVTGSAVSAAIEPENLNLITLPVKSVAAAQQALVNARDQSEAAASLLLRQHYDFDQADLLLTGVCRPAPGQSMNPAVRLACGADLPDGPLLVTTLAPLTPNNLHQPRMLVVNLSNVKLEAVREVLASYRRQITRQEFEKQATSEHWRLAVLDGILGASSLLPSISKAYAGAK